MKETRYHTPPRADAPDLRKAVATLAGVIAKGTVTPARLELEALAYLCDSAHLYAEAARVRRWMGR